MDEYAAARARGLANGAGFRAPQPVIRSCIWEPCKRSLEGQRRDAVACSPAHFDLQRRRRRLLEKQAARPRCPICMGPIDYSNPRARTTCGKRVCSYTYWNWFRRVVAA